MLLYLLYMSGFLLLNVIAFSFLERRFKLGRAFFCDLLFGFINPVLVSFSVSIFLKFYFIKTGLWALIDLPSILPSIIIYPLAIVFADFWGYLWHFAYHHSPLWRMHFIHHSTQDLRWHSILRFHPLENIITHTTLFIVLGSVGIPFGNYLVLSILIFLFSAISHAKLNWTLGWLGKIFVSPAYHSIHRQKSTQDKNLGLMFVWWDRILGRSIFEKQDMTETDNSGANDRFFRLLVYPFRIK